MYHILTNSQLQQSTYYQLWFVQGIQVLYVKAVCRYPADGRAFGTLTDKRRKRHKQRKGDRGYTIVGFGSRIWQSEPRLSFALSIVKPRCTVQTGTSKGPSVFGTEHTHARIQHLHIDKDAWLPPHAQAGSPTAPVPLDHT